MMLRPGHRTTGSLKATIMRARASPLRQRLIRPETPCRYGAFALMAAIPLVAAACGGAGLTSLAKLANNQDAYAGTRISTTGVVEQERNPDGSRYYVLTDRTQDLVILQPNQKARPYLRRSVRVTGLFQVNPKRGRTIRIQRITTQAP